jgi:hypothetical protein
MKKLQNDELQLIIAIISSKNYCKLICPYPWGGGSTQQSNGWGVGEVGAANELKNEDWRRAQQRKKWSLVDGMKYGRWRRMHNGKESCYSKRKVHPGG